MKNNQRVFIFLFVFFFVVAVGGMLGFAGKSSALDKTRNSIGAKTAVLDQTITATLTDEELAMDEEETEAEPVEAEIVVQEQEPEVEIIEIPQDQITVDETGEDAAQADADEAKETEQAKEDAEEETDGSGVRYFKFTVATSIHVLNVRRQPTIESKAEYQLNIGTGGYVLKPGNDWCYIESDQGYRGYCSTEYLDITEMTAEEFPEQLRDEVEMPDEELSGAFNS
ncbi:MAG: SH3 domain-containing protein [Butyrivibrio sp.]|nr:SH3 domain-containing protein [Butyrivibrio sp.]